MWYLGRAKGERIEVTTRGSRSLVRGRVSAQDVQEHTCVVKCLAAIVPLHDADHLRRGATGVLQPTDAEARLQAEGDLRVRVGELLLDELERRERALELVPLERVLPGLRKTRLERAHHAPRYAVSRAVEAGERRAETDGGRHQGVVRSLDVVHEYGPRRGRAQRELVADFGRGEPLHALVIMKPLPSEITVTLGKRKRRHAFSRMNPRTLPSHLHRAQIIKTSLQRGRLRKRTRRTVRSLRDRGIGNPCLASVKKEPSICLFSGGVHSSWV